MRVQHAVSQQRRRLYRRFPWMRKISLVTLVVAAAWLYLIHRSERTVFRRHIDACAWKSWEQWPREARPHRLVFIADPQLVDPHTYPGRPWPLSTLTERYTDLYMARNYRLINARLDPDSTVFLGDLFDGGREWATHKTRYASSPPPEAQRPRSDAFAEAGHALAADGRDLKLYVHGERGRWRRWGDKQWRKELARFGRIFWAPDQLYPESGRRLLAAHAVATHPVAVENGAEDRLWEECATVGGKARRIIAGLPGNHDMGFGSGVQWSVRDRFQTHFGPGNRVDVFANHTFVSIDAPSLSARDQILQRGGATTDHQRAQLEYLWKPTMDFMANVSAAADKAASEYLHEYFPRENPAPRWTHEVTWAEDGGIPPSQTAAARPNLKNALPVILLTHVPLFRPADSDCGPNRESGSAIRLGFGYQYQNVITQPLTTEIVSRISSAGGITHVFSGDDHDHCDILHRYNLNVQDGALASDGPEATKTRLAHIREITVKSFSWAMGVRRPGFQLVSLWNPVDANGDTAAAEPLPTLQTHLCLLPDQLALFIHYALAFAATLALLLLRALILALRSTDNSHRHRRREATIDPDPDPDRWSLPKSRPPRSTPRSTRHRASSTSISPANGTVVAAAAANNNNNNHPPSVQRSYTARTRPVSPYETNSSTGPGPGPLIAKAGYFPKVTWRDPSEESDEEGNVGGGGGGGGGGLEEDEDEDRQGKWKQRPRTAAAGFVQTVVGEFAGSLCFVAFPCMAWYVWLVRRG